MATRGAVMPLSCTVRRANLRKRAYLKDVDGDVADDVEKVPQGQAANQDVGPIPHTLVLVYDPQQGGIPDDPDHKNQAGHDGVDILEGLHELRGLQTHGGRALWWGGLWAQH